MTSDWSDMNVRIHGVTVVLYGMILAEIETNEGRKVLIQVVEQPPRYVVGEADSIDEDPALFINPFVEEGTEMGTSMTGTRMIQDDVIDFFPKLAKAAGWIS